MLKAGVDTGDMPVEDVAAMFGKTEGFKASDPVITPKADDGRGLLMTQ